MRSLVSNSALWRHTCVYGVVLLGTVAVPLGAQDSVAVVLDAVTCNTCTLRVATLAEIGDVDGPGIVGENAFIGRSDDGDYYVSTPVQLGRMLRFSPNGLFRTSIGRLGEGPGEYLSPAFMRGRADTVQILDIQTRRITTIRSDSIATNTLPLLPEDWALLPDGRYVFSAISYDPNLVGHPLHVYDNTTGRLTGSFGAEGVRIDRSYESRPAMTRHVAPAADGNIWAARENRYRIDKWTPDGIRVLRVERDAPWFRPWVEWSGLAREVRPAPSIVGLRDWGDGLLMVVIEVADLNWKPMPPARVVGDHTVTSAAQGNDLYDTVIEVLDTRLGKVLVRTRIDENARGLVGRDGFYSYAEHSELGEPKFVVWSVTLAGTDRRH